MSDSRFSALQRAEIAEIAFFRFAVETTFLCFSALQRAEIAEMQSTARRAAVRRSFSALQRAEIAEIRRRQRRKRRFDKFQCSSTSRNC